MVEDTSSRAAGGFVCGVFFGGAFKFQGFIIINFLTKILSIELQRGWRMSCLQGSVNIRTAFRKSVM